MNSNRIIFVKELTLEISLKPFLRKKTENYESIAIELFRQWQPVIINAEKISILLWAGDGSEILEFRDDMAQTFDWGQIHWHDQQKTDCGTKGERPLPASCICNG